MRQLKVKTPAKAGVFLCLITLSIICCGQTAVPAKLQFQIEQTRPHNAQAFTQGLMFSDGAFYESSGLYGKSFIEKYTLTTGTEPKHLPLPKNLFAEGLTLLNNSLYVLTWREGKLLRFDAQSFELIQTVHFEGEGWGLTHDGSQLYMSNGSAEINVRDATTFNKTRSFTVRLNGKPVKYLNELEFAQGTLWANVWQSPFILAIDPEDGEIKGVLDLSSLVIQNSTQANHSVLNGIAYNPVRQTFWITGKLWPNLYEIRILPPLQTTTGSTENHSQ